MGGRNDSEDDGYSESQERRNQDKADKKSGMKRKNNNDRYNK